jgi:membrane-bound inhibitor of C-type lysozyme
MKTVNRVAASPALAVLCLAIAGCGGMSLPSLWPLGERDMERSRVPANSITYQCAAGKRFYLRYLDNGAAAWVILPEREFRLDKVAGDAGTRYGNGKAVLTVNGDEVALSDGPTVNYAACKVPAPAEPAKK